jgi:hypothetical protein
VPVFSVGGLAGPAREGADVRDDEAGPAGSEEPARFVRRRFVLDPGMSCPSDDAQWRDAIVLVERGDVDLECTAGGRRRFSAGAVLWLAGIRLRALHNVGIEPVVLVAVSRRRPGADPGSDEGGAGRP